jgi:hypothetical protein
MFLLCSFLLVGCGEEMTPTEAVRDYMEGYVTLDDSVINQLNDYVKSNETLTDKQRDVYKEILRKQYSSLTYDIENEKIEGNTAYVKLKINVKDLYKIQKETNEYYEQNKDEFNEWELKNKTKSRFGTLEENVKILIEEGFIEKEKYTKYKLLKHLWM